MTDQEWLDRLCADNGYVMSALAPNGCYVALCLSPRQIIRAKLRDDVGWNDAWQYRSAGLAGLQFARWQDLNFAHEPAGWIRHIPSGRRISEDADEVDINGQRVGAVGVVYIRP